MTCSALSAGEGVPEAAGGGDGREAGGEGESGTGEAGGPQAQGGPEDNRRKYRQTFVIAWNIWDLFTKTIQSCWCTSNHVILLNTLMKVTTSIISQFICLFFWQIQRGLVILSD
jgi:hypothetical protein